MDGGKRGSCKINLNKCRASNTCKSLPSNAGEIHERGGGNQTSKEVTTEEETKQSI